MKKCLFCIVVVLFLRIPLFAQTVYLPATHEVYKFLDEMAAKQIITDYRDAVKPLSRQSIAKFLIQVDSLKTQLTTVEQEQLQFYKEEFYEEMKSLNYNNLSNERRHLYNYQSEPSKFMVDLIGSGSYDHMADGKTLSELTSGISAYGYAGSNVGAYFYYHDSQDAGSYISTLGSQSALRPLSPMTAVVPSGLTTTNSYDYNVLYAQVNVDLGFVTLSAEQMQNVWGSGENGNVILSTKAPAYPELKLHARLSKDIDFTYIHGWLFAGVYDSTLTSSTQFWGLRPNKYLAASMLEVTPWNGVNIAVGQSEMYGGIGRNPELEYLIPIMFFKAVSHGNGAGTPDNSEIFFNFKFNVVKKFSFYLPVIVNEFTTTTFLSPTRNHNQVGFTLGGNAYDLFYHDTRINVEYTRINPWVYNHNWIEGTYQSHDVNLGDWIGQNADLFTVSVYHRPLYNLEFGIQFQSLRKGGKESTYYQYSEVGEPSLLYGPITKEQSLGIVVSYQPVRDLYIDFHALRTRFTTQMTSSYTDNTGYNEFLNNQFDYLIDPSYSGKYDISAGIRYNIY